MSEQLEGSAPLASELGERLRELGSRSNELRGRL